MIWPELKDQEPHLTPGDTWVDSGCERAGGQLRLAQWAEATRVELQRDGADGTQHQGTGGRGHWGEGGGSPGPTAWRSTVLAQPGQSVGRGDTMPDAQTESAEAWGAQV